MRRFFAGCLLAGLALCVPTARSTDYRIAADRSSADFAIRLLWLHTIKGHFTQIAGQVRLDPNGRAIVDARIHADSITMDSARSRGWALGPEFFDAAHHPTIHFLSNPVELTTLTLGGTLDGRLSLRGVTRPVHFQLLPSHCRSLGAADCVIEARGNISRSAFGMLAHRTALSDQVQLGLSIVLVTP